MKLLSSAIGSSLLPAELLAWTSGLLLAGGLWLLLVRGQMDLLIALVIATSLLLLLFRSPAIAALCTIAYLFLMGDIRRIVAAEFGQPKLDLLLLIAPAIALVMALPLLLNVRLRDPLSKAMLLLLLVMVLEIFNPQQGGLTVGASGALFYIAPVLWFWVGRAYGSSSVVSLLIYKGIFPLAILAALMGLCQTFIGFLPYQQRWIEIVARTYISLHVGGSIRAFGFSVSSAEYATLLTSSAAGVAAAYFGSKRLWAITFPFLVLAVVLASSRGLVFKLIFALAVVITLREGEKLSTTALLRLGVLTGAGLIGLILLASRFSSSGKPTYEKGAAAQNALEHQAGGLAHPLDSKYSTAGVHGRMLTNGIVQGFVDPIGHGLGATTGGVKKFGGGSDVGSSEIDFSDMFISLGLVGGLTYAYIIFATLKRALQYVQTIDRTISLPVIALLTTTASAWLIGGQYSISSLVFFLIGSLVYQADRAPYQKNIQVSEEAFTDPGAFSRLAQT